VHFYRRLIALSKQSSPLSSHLIQYSAYLCFELVATFDSLPIEAESSFASSADLSQRSDSEANQWFSKDPCTPVA
jgi:hypothetical protein